MHNTVNQSKQSIVATTAYIVARMDMCSSLAIKNVACENELAVSSLSAETL